MKLYVQHQVLPKIDAASFVFHVHKDIVTLYELRTDAVTVAKDAHATELQHLRTVICLQAASFRAIPLQ